MIRRVWVQSLCFLAVILGAIEAHQFISKQAKNCLLKNYTTVMIRDIVLSPGKPIHCRALGCPTVRLALACPLGYQSLLGGKKLSVCFMDGINLILKEESMYSKLFFQRIILVFVLTLIFQGCAGVTQLSKEPINSDNITFVIPKNVNIAYSDGTLKGLEYHDEIQRGQPVSPGGPMPVSGVEVNVGNGYDTMIWTFYDGEIYFDVNHIERKVASSVVYTVAANISENERNFLVTLQPTEKEVIKGTGTYGNAFAIPDYSTDDLLLYLSQPIIEYTVEIDSP